MFSFDLLYIFSVIPTLMTAFGITIWLTVLTMLLSTVFGALLAWAKLGKNRPLKALANGYTAVLRCTPSIILLFLCYYGLPKLFAPAGIDLNKMSQFYYALIAFTLLNGAMMSEVLRSTYLSIDKGQFEAAATIGLTPLQTMYRVILPQGFYIALPNLGNTLVSLLKETSLAFTIGMVDLMGKAKLVIALNMGNRALEVYVAMTIIYWVLTFVIAQLVKRMEHIFGVGMNQEATARRARRLSARSEGAVSNEI